MLFLPVFMTFLFVNFPAGLVLYWLTTNAHDYAAGRDGRLFWEEVAGGARGR